FDLFWRLNRSTKRTDVLFYFSDFQNRQKTGISYSPIPESVDPFKSTQPFDTHCCVGWVLFLNCGGFPRSLVATSLEI
ncbi:hypothetical protein, partial [Loigolactobacillus backii]|uniref:hypothetical protein n=1 Tax=Loigolactobacillus backii TaxID=375175 RepID=UPI001EE6D290